MRHKTKDVPAYSSVFRVFNKTDLTVHAEFDALTDAVLFIKVQPMKRLRWEFDDISYTLKLEADTSYTVFGNYLGFRVPRKYETKYIRPTPWVILTDLGDVVSREEVSSARHEINMIRWCNLDSCWKNDKWNNGKKRLKKTSHSAKKIKNTYATIEECDFEGGLYYRNIVRRYFRSPKTYQEARMAEAHVNEYGNELVRSSRNERNLPHHWDDIQVSACYSERSWKHNSKRCKQWIAT